MRRYFLCCPGRGRRSKESSSVISVPAESEELKKAGDEARRRWPEFVTAFKNRTASQDEFAVKSPFKTANGSVEHMWIMVEEIEGDIIRGTLGNEPINVPHLKLDSPIEVHFKSISDWVYFDGEEMVGGFSIASVLVLVTRQSGQRLRVLFISNLPLHLSDFFLLRLL